MTTIAEIQGVVAHAFHTTKTELVSHRRQYAPVRQIAMFLVRELTPLSFPEIGHAFGRRHHTTVIHACKTVAARMDNDDELAGDVFALIKILAAPA